MIITDLSLQKVDKSDPRYPDTSGLRSVLDVYQLTFTADGNPLEVVHVAFADAGMWADYSPEWASAMLHCMADAIKNHAQKKAA